MTRTLGYRRYGQKGTPMNKNIDEITKKLEEGVRAVFESDRYKAYLDFMGKFYDYSANNCALIYMQKPDATLVAGYNTWLNKLKRQVRKGEKAIKILAPMPHKKEVADDDGNVEEVKWTTFRAVNVFDISQTDGDEVPNILTKLTGGYEDYESVLKGLKSVAGVPITIEPINGAANGFFSPSEAKIVLKEGLSEAQTIKTAVHEVAHSILHKKDGEEEQASRNTKEVQAESVAYIVCNWLGLDTAEYSFGYVAGWSRDKEAKELLECADVIKKTARQIIDGLKAA